MIRRIRAAWYRRGHRPRPGTLLYSPSLDVMYQWRDFNPWADISLERRRYLKEGDPDE